MGANSSTGKHEPREAHTRGPAQGLLQAAAAAAGFLVLVTSVVVARAHGLVIAGFLTAYVGSGVVVGAVALAARAARPRDTVVASRADEEMPLAA